MVARVAILAALAGCIEDHYACQTDADCNLGVAGRCELDHRCTQYDGTCPLERRYTAHSGAQSGQCFVDQVEPIDPCAAGQPPAPGIAPCSAAVCASIPSCCSTGWSEACAQAAQVQCGVKCDTRIAVIAERGSVLNPNTIELYDLRWDGTNLTASARTDRREFLTWIAPAPGDDQPRLAGLEPSASVLLVGDDASPLSLPVAPDRDYDGFSTVDFDRSGRDTAILASYNATDGFDHALFDLATGGERDLLSMSRAPVETWGDFDADVFPDAVAANGGVSYHFVVNDTDAEHLRQIDDNIICATGAGETPEVRSFAWSDLDANGRLDLVQFGSTVQIHFGSGTAGLRDTPNLRVDCDPPALFTKPADCTIAATTAFSGTTVPHADGTVDAIVSVDNTTLDAMNKMSSRSRNAWRLRFGGMPLTLAGADSINFQSGCTGPTCSPIRAVVARDLDGDGVLDLVMIDAALHVWLSTGRADGTFVRAVDTLVLPTLQTTGFTNVRVSVSGALR